MVRLVAYCFDKMMNNISCGDFHSYMSEHSLINKLKNITGKDDTMLILVTDFQQSVSSKVLLGISCVLDENCSIKWITPNTDTPTHNIPQCRRFKMYFNVYFRERTVNRNMIHIIICIVFIQICRMQTTMNRCCLLYVYFH